MKKLTSTILALSFVIAPLAEAKTISQIMQGIGISSPDADQRRAAVYSELRGKLTSKRDLGGLDSILKTNMYNDSNPISSSFFFKEFLNGASDAVLRSLRYSTPMAIDPSLSLAQYQAKLDQRDSQLCINAINVVGYTADGKNSEIDQLLSRIQANLRNAKGSGRGETAIVAVGQEEARIVKLLRDHVAQSPDVAGVRKVLGDVHDISLFNNRVRKVAFTFNSDKSNKTDAIPNGSKIELQLSMLASIRTGQDEAFVKIQNCLVEYLKAQKTAFGNRLGEIQKKANPVASAQIFASAGLNGVKPGPMKFDVVAKSQQKAYQLKFFYEGKQGFSSLQDEEQFLITRLVKIDATLPYLESRLTGALNAHKALIQLKPTQLDYLIDMMLQLNRDNLPLASDVTALRQVAQGADTATAKGKANFEAFVYFRQVARDLVATSEALDMHKARSDARGKDRRALQQIRN